MVNDGRPRACLTCKRRRIRCDHTRPSCARCVLAKIHCKWHTPAERPKITFVEINQTVAPRYRSGQIQGTTGASTTLKHALHDDTETQALTFFVRYYSLGSVPNGGPNPGLFGHVMPAISSSRTSAAAMSISAVALTVYSRWRMACQSLGSGYQEFVLRSPEGGLKAVRSHSVDHAATTISLCL